MKLTEEQFLEKELELGISPFNPKFVANRAKDAQMMAEFKHLKTIDYGCGVGVYSDQFQKAGFDIVAQDISKAHRDFVKKHYPDLKVVARPVKAELMLFIEVAEHMTDEEIKQAIEKIDPEYILFSSTSAKTDYDKIWGHVNIKEQPAWVKFWNELGYKKVKDLTRPTKWTFLLKKL